MDKQTMLEEQFYEMMVEAVQGAVINESIDYLEEAIDVYYALEEFFVENYRHLSIDEQVVAVVRGVDVNEELFDVLAEKMLDESIGTAIATAVHAFGQHRAAKRADLAKMDYEVKAKHAQTTAAKAGGAVVKAKAAEKQKSNSLIGQFKAARVRGKADKAKAVAKKAATASYTAHTKHMDTAAAHAAKQAKRADLASKIDTKISNAKKAVKAGANSITKKVGRFVGRYL